MLLRIADYAPDLPANNSSSASANLVNLYPRTKESYGPVNSLANYSSNALQGQCIGAYTAPDSAGNNYTFAGDATSLYMLSPSNPAFSTLNSQYSVPAQEHWEFTQFGNRVIAVGFEQNIQSYTLGSAPTTVNSESLGTGDGSTVTFSGTLAHNPVKPGTFSVTAGSVTGTDNNVGVISGTGISSGTINYKTGAWSVTFSAAPANAVAITGAYSYGGVFVDLSASAPQARYCAVIKDWLMVANTWDSVNGQQPQRVQWCAIDDPTTWPMAGSVQEAELLAGSQIIPGDQGWIQGIVGNLGTSDGAIFFERSIWRLVYSGSPTVFSFYPCEGVRGTPAPASIAQLGSVVFYLGEDGFYSFDGSVSTPIGLNRVDKTFWETVNQSYMNNVIGAVDPVNKLVIWIYPSTSSSTGAPDSMLFYNWALDKWGFAQNTSEYIFRALSQGYSLEGLDSVVSPPNLDALPFSLDSRSWTGGAILIGAFDPTHKISYFTGTALNATADTVEVEPYPQTEFFTRMNLEGQRAFVYNTQPMVDGGTLNVQVGIRTRLIDAPTYVSAGAQNANGECPVRAEGRYVRARITTSGSFNHLQGCSLHMRPSGSR